MATLHPTRRIQVIAPKFAEKFECIGSHCEDTCCAGWRVDIDKKTFKAYRQSTNPKLAVRFEKHVKRTRSQASEVNYARIELHPDTALCPMIDEHLCSIQKELGEDKLSNTCFTYPRTSSEMGGVYQQTLTLSCPEAARLALMEQDAMEFIEAGVTVRPEMLEKHLPAQGLSVSQMNDIRFFCINLIKYPGLELWQRLAFLGLFCESLTSALKTGGQSQVTEIMATTQGLLSNDQTAAFFENMQPQYEIQAVTFTMLWNSQNSKRHSDYQYAVHKAVRDGFGVDNDTRQVTEALLTERYVKGLKNLPKALKSAPWLLENYVVNEIWKEFFPFCGTDPFEHYLRLVIRFGLVRFMLAVQCSQEDDLPELSFMVQTVQTFCRIYQHDTTFAQKVNQCFENAGWTELSKIYRLLKA